MSGNESPGGDDSSLSSTSTTLTAKSIASSSSLSSIHQLDPKYKNYVSAIDKALKSFEYSSEWHDLISALSKLNKVSHDSLYINVTTQSNDLTF
jgi:FlaG/FlaF family flagellin (archaellin)